MNHRIDQMTETNQTSATKNTAPIPTPSPNKQKSVPTDPNQKPPHQKPPPPTNNPPQTPNNTTTDVSRDTTSNSTNILMEGITKLFAQQSATFNIQINNIQNNMNSMKTQMHNMAAQLHSVREEAEQATSANNRTANIINQMQFDIEHLHHAAVLDTTQEDDESLESANKTHQSQTHHSPDPIPLRYQHQPPKRQIFPHPEPGKTSFRHTHKQ